MATAHDEILAKMLDLNQALVALYNECDDKDSMVALAYHVAAQKVKVAHTDIARAVEYQEMLESIEDE